MPPTPSKKHSTYTFGEKADVLRKLDEYASQHPDEDMSLNAQMEGADLLHFEYGTVRSWVSQKEFIYAAVKCGYAEKCRLFKDEKDIIREHIENGSEEEEEEGSEGEFDVKEVKESPSWPVVLYIPNLLGYIRIALSFIGFIYALQHSPNKALNIWIVASLLDLVDGIFARKLNQSSHFGVLLDIVADNILRTIVWISSMIEYSKTDHETSSILVCAWVAIICLEWVTFFCTQTSIQDVHWKEMESSKVPPPLWIQKVFKNNFQTLPGIVTVYGLFVAPLGSYVRYSDPKLTVTWPAQLLSEQHVSILIIIAYVGRVLSAMVELWFCKTYIDGVIARDDIKSTKEKDP